MGSAVMTTIVEQKSKLTTNPDGLVPDTSRPIEQQPVPFTKTFDSIQQIKTIETASQGAIEFSNPLQQIGTLVFAPDFPDTGKDSILQQLDIQTHGIDDAYDGPIEQLLLDISTGPVQQFELKTGTTTDTSRPIEQQDPGAPIPPLSQLPVNPPDEPDATIDIEQFVFSQEIFPACNSRKNPINTNIRWKIRDFGFAFDTSTLIFQVEGIEVQDRAEFTITPLSPDVPPFDNTGLQLDYNPPEDFPFNTEIDVVLQITDTAVPPRTVVFTCLWFTTPDTRAPFFENISPACGSTAVDVLEDIEFDVLDIGDGVDPDSIKLSVEGITVCSGITIENLSNPSSGTGYHVTYTHLDDPFRFDSEVSIALEAADLSDTANSSLFICAFNTESSTPPEFLAADPAPCATFVDNRTGLTFEVYSDEHGVDVSTLEVRVDNKRRGVITKPKILRR